MLSVSSASSPSTAAWYASAANYPTVDAAIAQYEGYNTPGTLAARNNNPGNIVYGSFAQGYGGVSDPSSPYAVFPTAAAGSAAEDGLVSQYANQGYSLAGMIEAWNGQGSNSGAYASYVAGQAGINPTDPVMAAAGASSSSSSGSYLTNALNALADKLGLPGGATSATSSGSSSSAVNSGLVGAVENIGNFFGFAGRVIAGGEEGWSVERIVALVLALIVIAAALYLFKPVQQVVNTTVSKAAKAGSEAAAVA